MIYHRPIIRFLLISVLVIGFIFFCSSSKPPPKHLDNICYVLKRHPKWFWTAKEARKKWGVPISVQMAFIYKESHFRPEAKPGREKLLGLIPWERVTSAEGYAQATDETWRAYLRDTHQQHARRDDFATAVDFMGWYLSYLHRRLHIPKNNAYKMYLAYHEGAGGYEQKTYRKQPHLIRIAKRVQSKALRYRQQLLRCEKDLPKAHWWRL